MKIHKLPEQHIHPSAVSSYYKGNEHGLLLIHGFTGTPMDMRFLASELHGQGYTISIPRLPGHGTSYKDFHQSNWKQWLRRVYDEYMELESRCSSVSIVGLSMGGLLGIILASTFSPRKLVLAAPAVKLSASLLFLTPILSRFVQRYHIPYIPKEGDGDIVELRPEYWTWQHVWGGAHLYALQRKAKKRLSKVTCDTLTIVSKADLTVPWSAKDIIEKRIGSTVHKTIVLEDSPHVLVNANRKEDVAAAISNWLQP